MAEWFIRKVLARIAADAKVKPGEPRSARERAESYKRVIELMERERSAIDTCLPALRNMLRENEEELAIPALADREPPRHE